ncbi:MAG: acylglycerol lipase [Solirubrobacterales bacterium]|nr:acylglycerol lipase [Solirubrobacterales bacterium]
MRHVDGSFEGERGAKIYWQGWLPDGEPRGKLVVSHGAGEHSGRYNYLVDRLVPAGWAVYIDDHRGHGRSSGTRMQIDRLSYVVADLDRFVDLVAAEEPAGPPILLGHSMGGCIAIAYTFEHQDKLPALILSSPVAWLETASLAIRAIARVLSRLAPNTGTFGFPADGVSRDPDEVARYVNDPLVHVGKVPARTAAELAEAVEGLEERAAEISLPLLVMIGTGDPIVRNEGGQMIYDRASSADKTLKVYEGFFHELINEPKADRERVLGDIEAWLGAHAPPATPVPAAPAEPLAP